MAPPRNFNSGTHFKIEIQDAVVGLFQACDGIDVQFDVLEYAEGGESFVHTLHGQMRYSNLTLKRGITNEETLLKWFRESKKRSRRGAITVSLLTPGSKNVRKWAFKAAHPIKWTGPSLSTGSSNLATETLVIAHEGFV
jgi:phage tail-like protein